MSGVIKRGSHYVVMFLQSVLKRSAVWSVPQTARKPTCFTLSFEYTPLWQTWPKPDLVGYFAKPSLLPPFLFLFGVEFSFPGEVCSPAGKSQKVWIKLKSSRNNYVFTLGFACLLSYQTAFMTHKCDLMEPNQHLRTLLKLQRPWQLLVWRYRSSDSCSRLPTYSLLNTGSRS